MEQRYFSEWRTLKSEDIFHRGFQEWLRYFMDIVFLGAVIIYIITSFIVLSKSTVKMGKFRYTVFAQMTFNILYDFCIWVFNPILHWPLPLMSSFSHFPIPMYGIYLGVVFLTTFVVGGIMAFMMSLIFRVMAAFPSERYLTNRQSIAGCGALFICVIASLLVPLFFIARNPDDLQRHFEADVPGLHELYRQLPATIGIHPALTDGWAIVLGCILASWLISVTILLFGLNITFFYRLQVMRKRVSKETFTLHKMLHKVLLVQLFGAIAFASSPILIAVVTHVFQFRHGSWIANLAFPLTSFHVIFDSCCLLYFVKPYRRFISGIFVKRASISTFHSIYSHF